MNKEFYTQLKIYNDQYLEAQRQFRIDNIIIRMENFILNEAKKDPQNNELWFRLMSLQYYPPLEEGHVINEYADNVLRNDPDNIEALLVKSYSAYLFWAGITDEMAIKLTEYKNKDPEKEAMALVVLKFYYESNENWPKVEECLKKAISLAPHFPKPYFELAYYYQTHHKDQDEQAQALLKMGLNYVIYRTWREYYVDLTDISQFFHEYLTGIYCNSNEIDRITNYLYGKKKYLTK